MKKNILLILLTFGLCLPVLIGFSALSMIGVSALLIYLIVKFTFADYLKCMIAAVVFSAAFSFDVAGTIYFVLSVAAVSYVMGSGIRKKASFENIIILSAIAFLAVLTALILYITHKQSTTAFNLLFGDAMNLLKENLDKTEGMAEYVDTFRAQLELMLPSFLIVYAHFFVYVVFGISRTALEKHGYFMENMPHFYELHMSRTFTSVFMIILMFSLFGGISAVYLNIITVVTLLFSVCGLSVCDFYLRRGRVPAAVRGLIYFTGFVGLSLTGVLGSIFLIVLLGVGIFDSYKPLRNTGNNIQQ